MPAAAKLMMDSATAIRADAAGEMRARVGFSPVATGIYDNIIITYYNYYQRTEGSPEIFSTIDPCV